jgi:hypothetical protein
MTKNLTASEIARLRLPGLPTTKARVIARAKSEGWVYVEEKGLGGVRFRYQVPDKYWPTSAAAAHTTGAAGLSGPACVNLQTLQVALQAVYTWSAAQPVAPSVERKAAVTASLYDYLSKGADEKGVEAFFRAMR